MTDEEKLAEEYAKANAKKGLSYREVTRTYDEITGYPYFLEDKIKKAFLAGLKAGKLKWHDLRKNTEDLPKGDVHRTILLKDRYGNIYTGAFYPKDEYHKENCFSVEWLEYGFQGNNFVAFEQIAKWSEFPKEE